MLDREVIYCTNLQPMIDAFLSWEEEFVIKLQMNTLRAGCAKQYSRVMFTFLCYSHFYQP